jgi:hypothetical protein
MIAFGLLAGCANPRLAAEPLTQKQQKDYARAADDLDNLARETMAKMSPGERASFEISVENSAIREMQGLASRCGTSLVFSNEPRFEDRSVWTDKTASPDQIACVQRSFPFVKAAPQ